MNRALPVQAKNHNHEVAEFSDFPEFFEVEEINFGNVNHTSITSTKLRIQHEMHINMDMALYS